MRHKYRAFTLAEVLITLGIIGIIAAITIPNLISAYQKRVTATKLQRAISVINQAYRLSYNDVGEPGSAFDIGADNYFKTYWEPYIRVLTYCNSYYECGYKTQYPFTYINNSNVNANIVDKNTRVSFLTADGFFYIVYTANYGQDASGNWNPQPFYWVLVDINGGAEPNRVGKDVFLLTRIQSDGGGVQPLGYNLTFDKIKKDCSYSGLGQYCADYIRRAGWIIDRGYPWKVYKK